MTNSEIDFVFPNAVVSVEFNLFDCDRGRGDACVIKGDFLCLSFGNEIGRSRCGCYNRILVKLLRENGACLGVDFIFIFYSVCNYLDIISSAVQLALFDKGRAVCGIEMSESDLCRFFGAYGSEISRSEGVGYIACKKCETES